MPRTLPLLALALLLAGCTDSLGIGSDCAAQMASVRLQHGGPDETASGIESVRWIYGSSGRGGFYYDFDWGGGSCRVDGPVSFSRVPAGKLHLPPAL